jgi:hypothetical protein
MQMLYIIGNGSLHYNEELRFSLRSVEHFCPEITEIIVVGEKVNFLSDKVKFYPIKEEDGNKEYRIGMKVFNACKLGYVKGDFIFMNDDFFFTRSHDFTLNYCKGRLTPINLNHYQKAIHDTKLYLEENNKDINHFDVHTPIIYNSEKFLQLEPHLQKSRLASNGFVVKSLYGNFNDLKPTQYTDCKLSSFNQNKINQTSVFSCSDGAWHQGVRSYLKQQFPNKSKYEK